MIIVIVVILYTLITISDDNSNISDIVQYDDNSNSIDIVYTNYN